MHLRNAARGATPVSTRWADAIEAKRLGHARSADAARADTGTRSVSRMAQRASDDSGATHRVDGIASTSARPADSHRNTRWKRGRRTIGGPGLPASDSAARRADRHPRNVESPIHCLRCRQPRGSEQVSTRERRRARRIRLHPGARTSATSAQQAGCASTDAVRCMRIDKTRGDKADDRSADRSAAPAFRFVAGLAWHALQTPGSRARVPSTSSMP